MQFKSIVSILVSILLMNLFTEVSQANGEFQASRVVNFGKEQCFILNRFPEDSGARYRSKDSEKENSFCEIDFSDTRIGMCPKTWSTSPGTIIYDISNSKYYGNVKGFESEYCPRQKNLKGKNEDLEKLASFKQSINAQFQQNTSATFAQASPLYYHFSRFFNTTVDVPVAVMRTMDAQEHYKRIAIKGPSLAQGKMNRAGWNVVVSAERNPNGYIPPNELFYGDIKNGLIFGTLLKAPGTRYGPEFNGNISGKDYSDQYVSFQKTPAFFALTSEKGIVEAMSEGLSLSKKDSVLAKALGPNLSKEQMVFWMKELTEIVILDYIFNQQDRPGNIDYFWLWYFINDKGELQATKADSQASRANIASVPQVEKALQSPKIFLIQKTIIGDNDAGGRKYANFTKKFGLLEKIHHINP